MPGLPDDYLQILYEGGVQNCSEGALRLYMKNHGGTIWVYGLHFYYFPPDATDETRAQNLGEIFIEGKSRGNRWEELTLAEVRKEGIASTSRVINRYALGYWELEGGKKFADLSAQYYGGSRERGF